MIIQLGAAQKELTPPYDQVKMPNLPTGRWNNPQGRVHYTTSELRLRLRFVAIETSASCFVLFVFTVPWRTSKTVAYFAFDSVGRASGWSSWVSVCLSFCLSVCLSGRVSFIVFRLVGCEYVAFAPSINITGRGFLQRAINPRPHT